MTSECERLLGCGARFGGYGRRFPPTCVRPGAPVILWLKLTARIICKTVEAGKKKSLPCHCIIRLMSSLSEIRLSNSSRRRSSAVNHHEEEELFSVCLCKTTCALKKICLWFHSHTLDCHQMCVLFLNACWKIDLVMFNQNVLSASALWWRMLDFPNQHMLICTHF